jgi:DNA-binding IclR family transcriptional regulator
MPVLASATGQALAAFLPRSVVAPFIRRELKARRVASMQDAEALLERVRRSGLGRVTGEMMPGISALSAPVFDHQGGVVAALTALGSTGAFNADPDGAIGVALRAAARRISVQMGDVTPR